MLCFNILAHQNILIVHCTVIIFFIHYCLTISLVWLRKFKSWSFLITGCLTLPLGCIIFFYSTQSSFFNAQFMPNNNFFSFQILEEGQLVFSKVALFSIWRLKDFPTGSLKIVWIVSLGKWYTLQKLTIWSPLLRMDECQIIKQGSQVIHEIKLPNFPHTFKSNSLIYE